ncbi:MAG: SipW-dependent-type signal peptide-containing protein [Bacillota bacterium]
MRKRFLLALVAVAAVIGLTVGGTFALFSASTATVDNTFTAGSLCLTSERDNGDTVPGPMFYVTAAQGATTGSPSMPGAYPTGLWAPGDAKIRTLTVSNPTSCSTMSAWLTSVQASLQSADVAMVDELTVEVWTQSSTGLVKVAEAPLRSFLNGPVAINYPAGHVDGSSIPLLLTSNKHFEFKVKFDLDAPNAVQGQTLVVTFAVNAEQMPNNP